MKRVLAFIFAGVRDEGLSVLTRSRSVAAVPVAGKYRLIDFALSNCVNSELNRIAILAQHSPQSLIKHVGRGEPWDLNRRDGGVEILQPYERQEGRRWYGGTADALRQNWEVVENARAEHVLVLSSDLLYKMDYSWLLSHHVEHGAKATLAVARPGGGIFSSYGVLDLAEYGTVTGFSREVGPDDGRPAFLGVYVFNTRYLREVLDGGGENLFLDGLAPRLGRDPIHAYRFEGEWSRAGNLEEYLAAHQRLLAHPAVPDLHDPGWRITTRSEERAPAAVGSSATVVDSLLANGSQIEGTVERSVISPGAVIAAGARVVDSVILTDTVIEPGAVVERSILDKNVMVGHGAHIGGPGAIAVVGEWGQVAPATTIEPGGTVPPREPSLEEILAARAAGAIW